MNTTEMLRAIEAKAAKAIEHYEAGFDMDVDPALDVADLVSALRAVLALAASVTETDCTGDREWGDVPGWRLRRAITDALGGTP